MGVENDLPIAFFFDRPEIVSVSNDPNTILAALKRCNNISLNIRKGSVQLNLALKRNKIFVTDLDIEQVKDFEDIMNVVLKECELGVLNKEYLNNEKNYKIVFNTEQGAVKFIEQLKTQEDGQSYNTKIVCESVPAYMRDAFKTKIKMIENEMEKNKISEYKNHMDLILSNMNLYGNLNPEMNFAEENILDNHKDNSNDLFDAGLTESLLEKAKTEDIFSAINGNAMFNVMEGMNEMFKQMSLNNMNGMLGMDKTNSMDNENFNNNQNNPVNYSLQKMKNNTKPNKNGGTFNIRNNNNNIGSNFFNNNMNDMNFTGNLQQGHNNQNNG